MGSIVERFYDKRRRRALLIFSIAWLALASGWPALAGAWDIAAAGLPIGLFGLRTSLLEVCASRKGVTVKRLFRHYKYSWVEISHFETKRFGIHEIAVPSLVTTSGKRLALHGLDSTWSGFGARSNEWDRALNRLTELLEEAKGGQTPTLFQRN